LFVGRRDAYKNFWQVVESVKQFDNVMLTVVGPPLSAEERGRLDDEINGRYDVRSHVDDQTLVDLYHDAFALVYPSRYEGFGLPVVEAMACGCPVIALRASSIPEVAGEGAMLVDDSAPELLVATLEQLKDLDTREALVRRGLLQAAQFSWATAAAEYLALYVKVSASGARA
jgi:mannosyltransferase